MHSGVQSSSVSGELQSIRVIWWTFNSWVCPSGRSFADKAGGTGDISDNTNAPALSCCKFDQDDLMISSVSELYLMAVICLFWARDYFYVACWFWLLCNISKKLSTFAIQCNIFSSASLFCSMLLSELVVFNTGSSPASNLLLARANCPTTRLLRKVLLVVLTAFTRSHHAQGRTWPALQHHEVW